MPAAFNLKMEMFKMILARPCHFLGLYRYLFGALNRFIHGGVLSLLAITTAFQLYLSYVYQLALVLSAPENHWSQFSLHLQG